MKKFTVEVLYPEIANLYGDLANIRYLKRTLGDDCEVRETGLKERLLFLDEPETVDLVYLGTMTESSQRIVIDRLMPQRDEIKSRIEQGQRFLVTGNALEVFGKEIVDDRTSCLTDCDGKVIRGDVSGMPEEKFHTKALGIFDFHTTRDMLHRYNSLYLGKYGELDVVGFKSQFTQSYYDGTPEPLFQTTRGPGLNRDIKEEGIRHGNFMATYVIGPLLILNPMLMTKMLAEAGWEGVTPALEDAAMDAYRARLKEYSDPECGFEY